MKNYSAPETQTTRRILLIACATALAVAHALAAAAGPRRPCHTVTRALQHSGAPGKKAFLEGHAAGTQDYICLPSG